MTCDTYVRPYGTRISWPFKMFRSARMRIVWFRLLQRNRALLIPTDAAVLGRAGRAHGPDSCPSVTNVGAGSGVVPIMALTVDLISATSARISATSVRVSPSTQAVPRSRVYRRPRYSAICFNSHSQKTIALSNSISSLGAQQKSHAQYAENTFLQDDVYSVFQFSFDRMVSVFEGRKMSECGTPLERCRRGAAEGLSARAAGCSAAPRLARGMNPTMDLERAITPVSLSW